MYRLQDFYSQSIIPNGLQKGVFPKASDLLQEQNSSRVQKIAPPNLPVKDYLFISREKEMKVMKKESKNNFKTYVKNQQQNKFPKQDVKLLIDPYPVITVNEELLASDRGQNLKIQRLLKEDLKWHQKNNPKLSATVRQGRIPDLKYFTSNYDQKKIHEHKIDEKTIIQENQFKKIKKAQKRQISPEEKDEVFLTDLLKRAEELNNDFDPNKCVKSPTVETQIVEEGEDNVSEDIEYLQNQLDNFSQNLKQLQSRTKSKNEISKTLKSNATISEVRNAKYNMNFFASLSKKSNRITSGIMSHRTGFESIVSMKSKATQSELKEALTNHYRRSANTRKYMIKKNDMKSADGLNFKHKQNPDVSSETYIDTSQTPLQNDNEVNKILSFPKSLRKFQNNQSGVSVQLQSSSHNFNKSRRVLSSTLNNPNVNFKDVNIKELVKQSNQILDIISDERQLEPRLGSFKVQTSTRYIQSRDNVLTKSIDNISQKSNRDSQRRIKRIQSKFMDPKNGKSVVFQLDKNKRELNKDIINIVNSHGSMSDSLKNQFQAMEDNEMLLAAIKNEAQLSKVLKESYSRQEYDITFTQQNAGQTELINDYKETKPYNTQNVNSSEGVYSLPTEKIQDTNNVTARISQDPAALDGTIFRQNELTPIKKKDKISQNMFDENAIKVEVHSCQDDQTDSQIYANSVKMQTRIIEQQLGQIQELQKDLMTAILEPTFYERRAFIEDFRRKWREDRGMVSLFDKRQMYKKANGRVKSAVEKGNVVRKGKSPFQIKEVLGIKGSQVPISKLSASRNKPPMRVMNHPFILEGQISHQIINFDHYKQLNNRSKNLSQLQSTYKRGRNCSQSPPPPVLVAASLGTTRTQDSGGFKGAIYNQKKSEASSPHVVKKSGLNPVLIQGGSSREQIEADSSIEKMENDERRITLYRATESNITSFVAPKLHTIDSAPKTPKSDSENYNTVQPNINSGKDGMSLLDQIVKEGSSGNSEEIN